MWRASLSISGRIDERVNGMWHCDRFCCKATTNGAGGGLDIPVVPCGMSITTPLLTLFLQPLRSLLIVQQFHTKETSEKNTDMLTKRLFPILSLSSWLTWAASPYQFSLHLHSDGPPQCWPGKEIHDACDGYQTGCTEDGFLVSPMLMSHASSASTCQNDTFLTIAR